MIPVSDDNVSRSIDIAFIDRADMKQYIGFPLERARYSILSSCITEMLRKGLVTAVRRDGDDEKFNDYLMDFCGIRALCGDRSRNRNQDEAMKRESMSPIPFASSPFRPKESKPIKQAIDPKRECSKVLLEIVRDLDGISGRSLLSNPSFVSSALCTLWLQLEMILLVIGGWF